MNILIRVLIAVVAVYLANALAGPVASALGFPLTANGLTIFHYVAAGLGLSYIVFGKYPVS